MVLMMLLMLVLMLVLVLLWLVLIASAGGLAFNHAEVEVDAQLIVDLDVPIFHLDNSHTASKVQNKWHAIGH